MIKHFFIPTNQAAIQSLLGLTSSFRKFISKYASIMLPLTNLLKNKIKFYFSDKEKHVFE